MINVFFAPGTLRKELPTDRLAHPGFPTVPGMVWAKARHLKATMTYRRGYLLDHSHERLSAEKLDGLELDVVRPGERLNLEWWADATGWRFVRGWVWYPARPITVPEALRWIG